MACNIWGVYRDIYIYGLWNMGVYRDLIMGFVRV